MIRLLNFLAVVGLMASAVYAYSTKYDTLYQSAQVSKRKTELHKERQAIAVLRAEWQLLTRPDRLQAAVERHLALEPIGTEHLARMADLPARPDRGDEPRTTGSITRAATTRTVSTRTVSTRSPTTASR